MVSQLLTPSLLFRNIGNLFLVIIGFCQSFIKLLLWRPDVIFTKGGFVCLPVGMAAHLLKIPLVIHDSDAHPGLTNRILSKWATAIATGAPLDYYNYPAERTRYVGIPISPDFHEFTEKEKREAREKWGINPKRPLIVVTGGGLGAKRINDAVVLKLDDLLKLGSVVLVSGSWQYDELRAITPQNDKEFQLHSFIAKDVASLLGAADVVVARAGATSILELAALAKPTVLVPNVQLTGGHQTKNANVYLNKKAVKVVDETKMVKDPSILVSAVKEVLSNSKEAKQMAERFSSFTRPDAASDVADMILSSV